MDRFKKRKSQLNPFLKKPAGPGRLWCGKVQGLCDGTLCNACHMFPHRGVESGSILSNPTLTDHKKIGLIIEDEE